MICCSLDIKFPKAKLLPTWTLNQSYYQVPGADPGFKVRGAHLKKLRRAEGGAKTVGVFRVKNHDFTPKKSYFFQLRREARTFLGYFVGKITILRKKIIFFSNFRGRARAGCAPPPESAPDSVKRWTTKHIYVYLTFNVKLCQILFTCIIHCLNIQKMMHSKVIATYISAWMFSLNEDDYVSNRNVSYFNTQFVKLGWTFYLSYTVLLLVFEL